MVQSAYVGDEELFMYETGHVCAECQETLIVTDELVLLQIIVPRVNAQGQIEYSPFERADGSYAYEPYFFHSRCWDDLEERLAGLLEDEGCSPVHDAYSFRVCDACKSGIRPMEPVAMVSAGELRASKRAPNGEHSAAFATYEPTRFYCLSCIRAVNDDLLEMWDHISYSGECVQCTYHRVWREGSACTHEKEE